MGKAADLDLQLKRLPALLPNFNIGKCIRKPQEMFQRNIYITGLIHCGKNAPLCSSLHVSRYPAWGVIKVGGAFELHHGRDVLHDIATFARDSSTSTNLHALSPADFNNLVVQGGIKRCLFPAEINIICSLLVFRRYLVHRLVRSLVSSMQETDARIEKGQSAL